MSTVIKAGESSRLAQRLTTIDLADHLAEAERIVQSARVEARAIVAEARREAAEALRGAEQRGFAEGSARGESAGFESGQARALAEARERFDRELSSLREALERTVAEFEASKRELLVSARHDVLEFAIALGGRVVKRVAATDRGVAAANLEEALRLVSERTDVTVRVNPIDAESLRRFAETLVVRITPSRHVAVVEDAEIAPGGCVLTTPSSRVDARIEAQLNEIIRLLLGDRVSLPSDKGAPTPAE